MSSFKKLTQWRKGAKEYLLRSKETTVVDGSNEIPHIDFREAWFQKTFATWRLGDFAFFLTIPVGTCA
jgi:hypothetical protein